MGEIKVNTDSLTSEINNISNTGLEINYGNSNVDLTNSDIDPFNDFKSASAFLSTAITNYQSILKQDTNTMKDVVKEIKQNDSDLGNQIGKSSLSQTVRK